MKAAPFEYRNARSAAQAVVMLGESDMAKACGGSQSLGPMLNLRLAQVDSMIDLSWIDELKVFSVGKNMLRIGAAVTHARIEDGELPDCTLGLLPTVAASIAYRAVRNRGTIGGSLAHADPAADWVNTMCLLDAVVIVVGPSGERSLPASEFFVGPFTTVLAPNEVIVGVEVPCFSSGARWAYRKTCRKPGEFADAIAAAWVDPGRGITRALIGALGGMPYVIDGAEAVGDLRRPGGLARAVEQANIIDDYEREVHAVMLRRALNDLDRFIP